MKILNTNLERYEYLIELTTHIIPPLFKTRIPDINGVFELNAPPTDHYDYWIMIECDNHHETIKLNAWGDILNNKELPTSNYCNHLGDHESPPKLLNTPNR